MSKTDQPQTEANTAEVVKSTTPPYVGPPWIGSAFYRVDIDARWMVVTVIMMTSGIVFFGWRGLLAVTLTTVSTLAVNWPIQALRKKLQPRRAPEAIGHIAAMGMFLGALMPLFHSWWMYIAAGATLGLICLGCGRSHRIRIHPVAATMMLVGLVIINAPTHLEPGESHSIVQINDGVLRPGKLVVGDVTDQTDKIDGGHYFRRVQPTTQDAVRRSWSIRYFLDRKDELATDRELFIAALSAGHLVRLEEIFTGAATGTIGGSSAFLVIVLGFYLIYRRMLHWPTAFWASVAAIGIAMVLPVHQEGQSWTILALCLPDLEPAASAVFLSYLLVTSAVPACIMLLGPMTEPMSRMGRVVYGCILGATAVAALWFLAFPEAAYLGVITAGFLSKPLDAWKSSPFVK